MKNRDWFLKTATIDRLMQMNKRLRDTNTGVCILTCLMSQDEALDYCSNHCVNGRRVCFQCIQDFLNKER